MAQNWKINPESGDYVLDGGKPVETDSLTIPAYVRLKTDRTKWLYAPDDQFGSDLYLIKKRKTTQDPTLMESTTAQALQPIVDDGRASEIEVATVFNSRNALGMQIDILDAQGEKDTLSIPGLGV